MNFHFFSLGSNGDLDVGFILDGSESINYIDKSNWGRLLYFIHDMSLLLPIHSTQIGVVVFSKTAELRIKLDDYEYNSFRHNVLRLEYPESKTNTSGGLYVARTQLFNELNGDRPNAPNVAVLITDGESTEDTEMTIPYAEDLHRDGIRVICVGIGNRISEEEIRAISSPPHEKDVDYFTRKTFYFHEPFKRTMAESIKEVQVEMITQNNSFSSDSKG